jgi:excisionase family DNA binding protein
MTTKLLLSPAEACEIVSVRKSTLEKLMNAGEIPSIKVGRLRRVPFDGLEAWVAKQREAQQREQQEGKHEGQTQ